MAETATKSLKKISNLSSFTVEFGDIYNSQFWSPLLRRKFRGAWSIGNYHKQPEGGRELSQKLYRLPDIPGMHAEVRFREHEVHIYDPLHSDQDLMDKIGAVLNSGPIRNAGTKKWSGLPPETIKMDSDRLQTFVSELQRMERTGRLTVKKGKLPTAEEMLECEGRILHDPGSNNPHKAKYQDEVSKWIKEMMRAEG